MLEQKALKKTSGKEVYDAIVAEMKEAMKAEPFLSRNAECRKNKGDLVPLESITNKIKHKAAVETNFRLKKEWFRISRKR